MVLPEADWKNQPQTILDWLTVGIGVVLFILYLYQWWAVGWTPYFGLVFFVWLVVFFTGYWQPILYLLMALIVAFITGDLFFSGSWKQPIGQAAILLNITFGLLTLYLFFKEEPDR